MADNQPKEYDAVLGGQLQVPVDGVVLGGIEGVKKRLALEAIEAKLAALKEALKYGDTGLDLIIEAFQNQPQLKQFAYTLLYQHSNSKAKQLIEKCNQYEFFQCIDSLEGHQYEVAWVRFSSDGKKLISASKDMTIKVWDLHTGRVIQNIKTDISKRRLQTVYVTITLSLDEKIICSSTDHNPDIEVWNLNTGSKLYTLQGCSDRKNTLACALAISRDGQTLFSSGDNCIKVWDLQTGNLIRSFAFKSDIASLCVSPDGKTLFSGTYNEVILWNWQTGFTKSFKVNPKPDSEFRLFDSLTMSLDGRLLAGMSWKTIKIWNLETGQETHSFKNEKNPFAAINLSPDGQTLVISPWGQPIEVWDLKTRQLINNLEFHPTQVIALALSPDGKNLVTGSIDHIIRLWDLHKKQQINALSGPRYVYRLWLSQDGKILVTGSFSDSFEVWDTIKKKYINSLPQAGNLPCLAISPDSKTLISRSSDETLTIWDLDTAKETGYLPVDLHKINDIVISPDSKTLVCCYDKIQLWNITTGKLIRTFSKNSVKVNRAAISLDGNMLVTGMDNNAIIVWDWHTGNEIRSLVGHRKQVNSIAISLDGNLLASGSDDKTIVLWNLRTGKKIHVFHGHSGEVYSVAISPYGQVVFSGSRDATIKIWDIKAGKLVHSMAGHLDGVHAIAISPDGQTIYSGTNLGRYSSMKIWGVPVLK